MEHSQERTPENSRRSTIDGNYFSVSIVGRREQTFFVAYEDWESERSLFHTNISYFPSSLRHEFAELNPRVSNFSMTVVGDGKPTGAVAVQQREEEPHRSRLHGKGAAVG